MDTLTLVEQRTYTLLPGRVPEYMALYQAQGLPVQLPILSRLLGYYSVEVGALNTVVHLWGFADHADREARRARLQASAPWRAYWAQARELIVAQQTVFLKPAPFFTAPLAAMAAAGMPHSAP